MPENNNEIPDIVIGRLPLYLRALQYMVLEEQMVTSSKELAERLGISAAQIRKDLSQFGEFGKQGTGYQVEFLIKKLRQILNVDTIWDVIIIGAGDIGHGIARYPNFGAQGFRVVAVFDNNPNKIGTKIGDFSVQDSAVMPAIIKQSNIKIAMIAVPASQAQLVVDDLIQAGIKAILNYAPITINVPKGIQIQYIDPVMHLQKMTYYLK
ncbi:MAG: redox-sensing transcriptional repressor Rex [Anaerolineales bacterium]|nr:redox-sensing transcriptional repressor Rex [Anaerolineales bacterium]